MKIFRTSLLLTALMATLPDTRGQEIYGAAISRDAGLPVLVESADEPEVRVWRTVALLDEVEGWVVTPGEIRFYAGQTGGKIGLVRSLYTPDADAVLASFAQFNVHSGQWLLCNRIKDGWGLEIEGLTVDGYFHFGAGNPNQCSDGPSRDLWQAYQRLSKLTHVAP